MNWSTNWELPPYVLSSDPRIYESSYQMFIIYMTYALLPQELEKIRAPCKYIG
jgi:hypothetical protein